MVSIGRIAAISSIAATLGFVGGAWFISSGYGFQLLPVPALPAPPMAPASPTAPGLPTSASPSKTLAVGMPPTFNPSGGSGGLSPRARRFDLSPTPGCAWEVDPRPLRPHGGSWFKNDTERHIVGYPIIEPWTGSVRFLLIEFAPTSGSMIDLRPVFFDEEARLIPAYRAAGGSSSGPLGDFVMSEFRLNPISDFAFPQIAYYGIERVQSGSAKKLSDAARREAKVAGIDILPEPRLGEPYPFDLPTADGQRVRSRDLEGKVVLVSIWGPDSFALNGLMMSRRLRESYREEDLAIVGVSFHESPEKAKTVSQEFGPDGPLVVLPNDEPTRKLWVNGSEIDKLPKLFLIDREGILRFIGDPFSLREQVDILLGRADQPFSIMIRPSRSH